MPVAALVRGASKARPCSVLTWTRPRPERPEVKHPTKKVRATVTREESLFLDDLRRASKQARNIAFELPYLSDAMPMAVYLALNGRVKKRTTKGR